MKKNIAKFLTVILLLSLIFSLAACNSTGDSSTTSTTEPPVISKTTQPVTGIAVIDYFNTVMADVKAQKPAVKPEVKEDISNVKIDNDKKSEGADVLKATIPSLKKMMLHLDAPSTKYGEDLTAKFPVYGQSWSSSLTVYDIKYAMCTEQAKTYEITIRFKDEANPEPLTSSHGKAFNITPKADIMKELDKSKTFAVVKDYDLLYTGCIIKCSVDRATDQVLSVTYIKNVNVSTEVTAAGSLKDYGNLPVTFTYNSTITYTLDWAKPE